MHYFRQTWLLAVLGLACGDKDGETSVSGSSDTGVATSSSSAGDTSTGDAPTTTGASSSESSSGGADESTADPPACETSGDDCGVTVSESTSACADPPPAKDELVLEALGPGSIKITEKGRTSACNITITMDVILGPNRYLVVNYTVNGTPDPNCQCPQEVTATVSGLTKGTWTVSVGSYEGKVDVP